MGAVGHDFPHVIAVEGFHILHSQHLEEVFIAHAPSRIACTILFFTENGKVHIGRFQHFRKGFGDLDIAVY